MVLLGSTGSIGVNTLEIAKKFNYTIEVISCGENISLLNEQIKTFQPKTVVIKNQSDIKKVNHNNVYFGQEGIIRAIEESNSDIVVNAIVGFAGLNATLHAQKCGKKIALANKESLVVAGNFIDTKNIVPIDSEHFGLWYLQNNRPIKKLIITASGGAFRDWELDKIKDATYSEALKHPNWNMGSKITIDSATMTNKLFEVIEAKWLFNTDNIDSIIETKSIIHSLIDFKDGSTTAHIANTSMQLPIAFALNQNLHEEILESVDLLKIGSLDFREIESERYPIWSLKESFLANPDLGVIINAANEIGIELFSKDKISFFGISDLVFSAVKKFESYKPTKINDVFTIDTEVRDWCLQNN